VAVTALDFWLQRTAVYPRLSPLAEDVVAAPASQAFVERIFSVAGMLSQSYEEITRDASVS